MKFPSLIPIGLSAAFLTVAPSADGTTATASLVMTASVPNVCLVTANAISFGSYDPLVANATVPATGTGRVTITCTKGSVASVALDMGLSPAGALRRMRSGSDFVGYDLYQPSSTLPLAACSFSSPTLWGTAAPGIFAPPPAPSRAGRTYNVCGSIPAAQNVPARSYSDRVVATVNF